MGEGGNSTNVRFHQNPDNEQWSREKTISIAEIEFKFKIQMLIILNRI